MISYLRQMTRINSLIKQLESFAPPALQESYDNCGLITGTPEMEVKGIMVSLDCTEEVIDDAIANNCNVIIAHHPIVFSGLKKLNGKNYIERTVIKAVKHDIAIYAIHTNLDNVRTGVNAMIASKLGLTRTRVLAPKKGLLRKLIFFCPSSHAAIVRQAVFNAGAGNIGKYDQCSFRITGSGSFRPGPDAQPFKGEKGVQYDEVEEMKSEMPFKEEVKWVGYMNVDELSKVIGGAYALVYTSLFEGFGIPILEALQCDVPAIISNTSSMPEVAGEAALQADPSDPMDIADKMHLIYRDEALRARLVDKARIQIKKFDWNISAKKLWDSIMKCVQ